MRCRETGHLSVFPNHNHTHDGIVRLKGQLHVGRKGQYHVVLKGQFQGIATEHANRTRELMTLIILIIVWLATLAAFVVRIAIVRRARRARTGSEPSKRSPHLLDARHDPLLQAIDEAMEATPVLSSSEPATAEHVRDRAQEDLYVGP